MKNNKGFTTVEVLVCFVVVSIVMMSLFSTISSFNEKKIQESYRSRIYEFKNTITNMIQEDLIKRGLSYARVEESVTTPGDDVGKTYRVWMTFKDGTSKKLVVHQRFSKTAYRIQGTNQDDDFYIEYGAEDDMIRYELPDLGETKGYYDEANLVYVPADENNICYKDRNKTQTTTCLISKTLQINNIAISITNEADPDVESHVLNIYIGFYHPNLGTKYAINIVCPIDYQSSSADKTSPFPTTTTSPNSNSQIYYP